MFLPHWVSCCGQRSRPHYPVGVGARDTPTAGWHGCVARLIRSLIRRRSAGVSESLARMNRRYTRSGISSRSRSSEHRHISLSSREQAASKKSTVSAEYLKRGPSVQATMATRYRQTLTLRTLALRGAQRSVALRPRRPSRTHNTSTVWYVFNVRARALAFWDNGQNRRWTLVRAVRFDEH